MKIAIVDDEKQMTQLIESYLLRYSKERNTHFKVDIFNNPLEFLSTYTGDYDLILMDIQMPGLNGIETAKELRRIDASVVLMFITNMMQYAIHGYEVDAIDFVVKPISYGDFVLKMQKASRYVDRNKNKKISLNTSEGIVQLDVTDIHYVEVIRHDLIYHTVHGQYKVRGSLREAEKALLDFHFTRSNHCYLVNLKYVEAVSGNLLRVAGEELVMSRNKKNDVLLEFAKYVGGLS